MTESNAPTPSMIHLHPYQRARVLLTTAGVVCFAMFYMAARLLRVPPAPGQSVSLLQQSGAMLDLVVVLVVLIFSALIGSVIAGSIRRDAGLVAACLGLMAISVRGGTMAAVLQSATSPGVYSSMAVETVLLYLFVVLAYFALAPLRSSHYLPPDSVRDFVEPMENEPLGNKLLATTAQVMGMLILMLLLAQSPDKVQSLAAVFLASLIATAAAHTAFPVEGSIYFWIGPGIVALVGYVYAAASPGAWLIGVPANALASPLPLDYAAAGPAGAIMGYWWSRKWQRTRESDISGGGSGSGTSDAPMPMG